MKKGMRDACRPNVDWQFKLVHGNVNDKSELPLIKFHDIALICSGHVLEELCGHTPGELFGGAGTDIAEIIRYYAERGSPA